jgi:hypothetical protein
LLDDFSLELGRDVGIGRAALGVGQPADSLSGLSTVEPKMDVGVANGDFMIGGIVALSG